MAEFPDKSINFLQISSWTGFPCFFLFPDERAKISFWKTCHQMDFKLEERLHYVQRATAGSVPSLAYDWEKKRTWDFLLNGLLTGLYDQGRN